MKRSLLCLLLALTAASTAAMAQKPAAPADKQVVSETLAGSVTLPASASGALVMAPCAACPPASFRATASTTYFIGEQQVTLAELKAQVTRRPQGILTVSYGDKTRVLISVSAEPPPRRPGGTQ